jgi:hypothetical protein
MVGFPTSLELSPSPEQMEFCGTFLSEWNFAGISFGGLSAKSKRSEIPQGELVAK